MCLYGCSKPVCLFQADAVPTARRHGHAGRGRRRRGRRPRGAHVPLAPPQLGAPLRPILALQVPHRQAVPAQVLMEVLLHRHDIAGRRPRRYVNLFC